MDNKPFISENEPTESLTKDEVNLRQIIPVILKLQKQKSQLYGRSYCRHGNLSIFFNLERKWDRIANMVDKSLKSGNPLLQQGSSTETFFDTVIDLASYSLLWAGYLIENDPEVLKKFIADNELSQ